MRRRTEARRSDPTSFLDGDTATWLRCAAVQETNSRTAQVSVGGLPRGVWRVEAESGLKLSRHEQIADLPCPFSGVLQLRPASLSQGMECGC